MTDKVRPLFPNTKVSVPEIKPLFPTGTSIHVKLEPKVGKIFSTKQSVITDEILNFGYDAIREYSDLMVKVGSKSNITMTELNDLENEVTRILNQINDNIQTLTSILSDFPEQKLLLEKQISLSTLDEVKNSAVKKLQQYQLAQERLEQLKDFELLNVTSSTAVFNTVRKTLIAKSKEEVISVTNSAINNQNKLLNKPRGFLASIFRKRT